MASSPPNSHITHRRYAFRVRTRRAAGVTLEAILAIPLLVIVLFATFQFSMILTVQQTLQYAAIKASREAALLNTTLNSDRLAAAITVATDVLAVHGLDVCPTLPALGDVQVISEDADDPTPTDEVLSCGPTIVTPPSTPSAVSADSVRIHLAVNLDSIPVPNLLDYFGFDLSGKYLYVKSDAIKEYP